jgi:protein gp37
MSDTTKIEWTDATWNPITGCSKVSQGCKNCYALRDWKRLAANPKSVYAGREFTDVMIHPERLSQPLCWTKPRMIFVNSMSDLFHESVHDAFIDQVFAVMALANQHIFQVLTKRPERMHRYLTDHAAGGRHIWMAAQEIEMPGNRSKPSPGWPLPNVWLGVSVEDQEAADKRIPLLLDTPAAVRWISAEPLLGMVDLTSLSRSSSDGEWTYIDNALTGFRATKCGGWNGPRLDWVVVGGESGPDARPMHPEWARSLRDQCADAGVPFLFKQWGEWAGHCYPYPGVKHIELDGTTLDGPTRTSWSMKRVGKKIAGRLLDGVQHDGYPNMRVDHES